jgi:phosphomannomutase
MKISISGVRGIYGSDLTLQEVSRFSRLFASSMIKSEKKCILARDTRPSGRIIIQIVSASLMEQGIDVYSLDIAPTPMAFREARKYQAGLIVTASHNPLEWNGLKFITEGRGIFENELDLLLKGNPSTSTSLGKYSTISSDYVNELADLIKQPQSDKVMKVGVDPGGGATCKYVDQLFQKFGYISFSVNDTEGISSRSPDPTSDDLKELVTLVTGNKLDIGFAFDLDGDRLVVVDSSGKKLNPDATLLLCVASALNLGMKKFVASIDTSVSVEKFIKTHGGKLDYSKVGEANVVKKMLDTDADAGGEGSSAGFILPKFNKCRDGFLASAIISTLDMQAMNECLSYISDYAQIRSKVAIDSILHMEIMEKFYDLIKGESSQILTIDGIKTIIDDDSWVLIRPSNTEDAIRISVESKTTSTQHLFDKISEKVQSAYEYVKRKRNNRSSYL